MRKREEFEAVVKEHGPKIYRMIARYISDACTIEDLQQHTFMQAWIHRETFKGGSSISTWLTSIAINTALNYLHSQKAKKARNHFDFELIKNNSILKTEELEQLAVKNQEISIVTDAVNQLPDDMRKLVILHIYYELTYEQVARAVDIPVGTVRSRLSRARFLLKKLILQTPHF